MHSMIRKSVVLMLTMGTRNIIIKKREQIAFGHYQKIILLRRVCTKRLRIMKTIVNRNVVNIHSPWRCLYYSVWQCSVCPTSHLVIFSSRSLMKGKQFNNTW